MRRREGPIRPLVGLERVRMDATGFRATRGTARRENTGDECMTKSAQFDSAIPTSNRQIADRLAEYSDLLEKQGEDGFRARAYRDAVSTVAALSQPLQDILRTGGDEALIALATIGRSIAAAIVEMLNTGHGARSDRLCGALVPEKLFQPVPGIGPKLAARLADENLETLEQLETALQLGDRSIAGIGPRRRKAITAILAQRLARLGPRRQVRAMEDLLLRVDALYRSKAAAGQLTKIAPKRFNPKGETWLPILHARHDDWHFTVLFSNTALAHKLDRTGDWVAVYFQKVSGEEGRCTIVTETRGPQAAQRVVRGREAESADLDKPIILPKQATG